LPRQGVDSYRPVGV